MKCTPDTALAITRFVFFVIAIALLIIVGTKYYYTTKDNDKGVLVKYTTIDRELEILMSTDSGSYLSTTETTKTTTDDGNTFSYPISNSSSMYPFKWLKALYMVGYKNLCSFVSKNSDKVVKISVPHPVNHSEISLEINLFS